MGCAALIPFLCTKQPLSTPMPNKTMDKCVCISLPGEAVYIDLVLNPCTYSNLLPLHVPGTVLTVATGTLLGASANFVDICKPYFT